MPMLTLHDTDGYLHFDEAECRAAGRAHAAEYRAASPFPHIVLDDFLDADMLRRVAASYPDRSGKDFFDRDQERYKYQYRPDESPSGLVRNLLAELNGRALLAFLEELTGIRHLISDPHFAGGGLHETLSGGHLSVHADFNIHGEMKVERRLNLLIYLNEQWPKEYGGELELWDREMKGKERTVAPLLGRAVIFNTDLDSYHGHPDKLDCPPGTSRRSIATYYYSAFEEGLVGQTQRTTNFRRRPGTPEKRDWTIAYRHFVNDWVPPRLQRYAMRLGPR